MKNELAPQQPYSTIQEQQAQIIRESCSRQQEIPISTSKMSSSAQAALERLVRIARGDSGQSRTVGDFLLAWWNAEEYGGFNLTDIWAVDTAIAEDMIAVLTQLVHCRCYPDSLGYGQQFQSIVQHWR